MANLFTMMQAKEKIVKGDLTLTKSEALDLGNILNTAKSTGCVYDWEEMTLWLEKWDIIFKIVEKDAK